MQLITKVTTLNELFFPLSPLNFKLLSFPVEDVILCHSRNVTEILFLSIFFQGIDNCETGDTMSYCNDDFPMFNITETEKV